MIGPFEDRPSAIVEGMSWIADGSRPYVYLVTAEAIDRIEAIIAGTLDVDIIREVPE